MIIASEVMPGIIWNVKRVADGNAPDASVLEAENEFIRSFNPAVLSNGLTGKSFCMDTWMPTGRLLENIVPTWGADGTGVYHALIVY